MRNEKKNVKMRVKEKMKGVEVASGEFSAICPRNRKSYPS
jgi:hypothetical protein